MAIPHRQRAATPNASGARRGRRPRLPHSGQARARAIAVYALASLATLGLVGTSAAHYGGVQSASDGMRRRAACSSGEADARCPADPSRARRLRLAYSGDNPFLSFLKGLFGGEQRSEPRRGRAPERGVPRQRALPPMAPPSGGPEKADPTPPGDTYRTMCVRLCDGYYWPVSFAAPRERFERDQRVCVQSCSSSAALYYYPNPGGEVEDMQNLQGVPYKSLGTAFLYRTTYDANCKCRAHPWEAAAVARHQSYAKPPQVRAASRGGRRGP